MSKKGDKLDEELGQETAKLGKVPTDGLAGGRTTTSERQKCVCCGVVKAKAGFLYCFSCHKKWQKVHDDYVASGYDDDVAKKRATKAYPPRYN